MQGFSNKYLDLQVNGSFFLSLLQFLSHSKSAFIARSLTKIGQTSMNQTLMVLATKSCSLLFDIYPRILCESSLNGCSHQILLESFTYRFLMNQALMVVATKSCSNSFPKLSSIVIYIYILFIITIIFLNFFEIQRERVTYLHKVLPSRLV